ncbi:Arginyl-tRNA--protein transferase 1, partial [Chytridiales sp. JEL 0842]
IVLEPASYTYEVFDLYSKYQRLVHKDPPSRISQSGFKSFLVDSPLKHVPSDIPGSPGFGSFHQKYYIDDDRLIAVAVIDILPKCVSSVYFMYDPDPEISFLSPGVYSAVREISLTLELNKMHPELKYYYMGYYIHTCPKMRYKARFKPSDLACPETFEWVPVEKCVPFLDKDNVVRLSGILEAEKGETARQPLSGPQSIAKRDYKAAPDLVAANVVVFDNGTITRLGHLQKVFKQEKD